MELPAKIRDRQFFVDNLYVDSDRAVRTKVPLKIYVPKRYQYQGLCSPGEDSVHVLGIYGLVSGDRYATNIVDATVELTPFDDDDEVVDDVEYIVYEFLKGSVVMKTVDLVIINTVVYSIYNEFISSGRVPWFMGFEDLSKIFKSSRRHANVVLADSVVFELMVSMIMRDPKELSRMYRTIIKSYDFVRVNPPTVVPFNSVIYNTHSTLNKIVGAYFDDSITAATTQRSEKADMIEEILRM